MAEWDHVIYNGKLADANDCFEANIYIKDGKIAAVTEEILPGAAQEETDARGQYVLPGLMDTHVHSRDPGSTRKEDFYHSTLAAAAGGITLVFEMPNTNPPVNHVDNFHKQVRNLSQKANVDFGLWGICLGDLNIDDLFPLYETGVIGFKFFWGYAVNSKTFELVYNYNPDMEDVIPPFQDGDVYKMFREVAKTGKILAIHAENNELIQILTGEVRASGRGDYEALIEARPDLAEKTTIQTGISFAKHAGTRLHILHITSGAGVDAVRDAKERGEAITAETCPHFLFLSNEDYERVGPAMKVYPPVKYKKDQDELWEGIADGTISVVCSDHAPHTEDEKDGDLWSIPAGMCGVETMVPLMLNAVNEGKLTIQQVAALLSENPARLYDIYPRKGSFHPGTDADFTIVDLEQPFEIKKEHLHSKSKVTAFDGFKGKGAPVATIVRGQTIMKNGDIISERNGCLVKPLKAPLFEDANL
ncbi:dihydroorotase/allantoinase [Scopulibacillus darangshiensis]|uniref:allantoinase n=1 Tax=Scopulibacillus darangshiensis TaxID=442528 RepID=A0A4R2NH29_9BACL|nr:allantoinase AllB [Scopulibacillus darangshiensis]TCP20703.1 dihydroorotase/allantoinase [Scopulibacillus darangshiensis]